MSGAISERAALPVSLPAPAINTKITLNFSWTGPSRMRSHQKEVRVKAIDVIFANFSVSLSIPDNIQPFLTTELSYRVQILGGPVKKEAFPSSLKVAIGQMHGFKVNARIYMGGADEGSPPREVPLDIPKGLKIGQTYDLAITSVATSNDLSLLATLLEKKEVEPKTKVFKGFDS